MSKDISKCSNTSCPIKEDCYRWTMEPKTHQSYTSFEYNQGCDYFIIDEKPQNEIK